jgi:hypothetical protein
MPATAGPQAGALVGRRTIKIATCAFATSNSHEINNDTWDQRDFTAKRPALFLRPGARLA